MIDQSIISFIRDCAWQSTVWLSLGWAVSLVWRRWPTRAHCVMLLGIIGCLSTPFLSWGVHQAGWGLISRPLPQVAGLVNGSHSSGIEHDSSETSLLPAGGESLSTEADKISAVPTPARDDRSSRSNSSIWFSTILALAWAALSIWVFWTRFRRVRGEISLLRQMRPVSDPGIQKILEQVLLNLKLTGIQPKVFESDQIHCPIIF